MKHLLYLLLLPLVLSTSCAGLKQKKWLKSHETSLAALAKSSATPEAKLDGLMTTYALLMEEGLRFGNPAKGAKYIGQFQKQNEGSIKQILKDAEQWRSGLTIAQGLEVGLGLPKKAYIKNFVSLAPRFKRKYQQYKFIADMTSSIGGGFGKIGAKVLGL